MVSQRLNPIQSYSAKDRKGSQIGNTKIIPSRTMFSIIHKGASLQVKKTPINALLSSLLSLLDIQQSVTFFIEPTSSP